MQYGMRKCVKKDAIVSIASGDSNQSYYTSLHGKTPVHVHVVIILVAINLAT